MVTVAGLVPCAVSGVSTLWRCSPRGLVVGTGEQEAGQLALRAGRRLERHVRQPGDLARARPGGATSARARPARTRGPGAGAGGRGPAAPPAARAASGCASSCTSRAGRSPRRGGSSWTRAWCSGARSRARAPPAAPRAARAGRAAGSSSSSGTSGTSSAGAANALRPSRERSKIVTVSSSRRGSSGVALIGPPPPRAPARGASTSSASRSMSCRVRRSVIATSSPSSYSG